MLFIVLKNYLDELLAFLVLNNLLNNFLVNAGLFDYSINLEVFLKILQNWDEIFLIDIADFVDDDPFMLLVEDKQLPGLLSW